MGRRIACAALAALIPAAAPPAAAQLLDILTAPKTLIERAVEDRSVGDIAKDNEIVVKVNAVMADVGTVQASTAIYEQRLLVTGLFDDKADYEKFRKGVAKVDGVKKLYWHAVYMPKAEQEKREKAGRMKGWAATLGLSTKAEARLATTGGISHTNYRTPVDPLGTLYLLGRALSKAERDKAIRTMKGMEGVNRVVDYVEVRPKK